MKRYSGINKVRNSCVKSLTDSAKSKTVHHEYSPESINTFEMDSNLEYSLSPGKISKLCKYDNTMRTFQQKPDDIEALIDVEGRTIVFEKPSSELIVQKAEIESNYPLHQITWYQDTSLEDIESAIDEVVEIMQEMKNESNTVNTSRN